MRQIGAEDDTIDGAVLQDDERTDSYSLLGSVVVRLCSGVTDDSESALKLKPVAIVMAAQSGGGGGGKLMRNSLLMKCLVSVGCKEPDVNSADTN